MLLSLNWLKEYVDIEMAPSDLAHLLTMSGMEVEGIEPVGLSLRDIVVTKIISVRKHPDAGKLSICQVDAGKGEVQVVCGAPNLEPGALAAMALPGCTLPTGIAVKESRIRGEQSAGMLLAEDEMGLTDDHTGIMILPDGLEPGVEISKALPLEDYILEISLTPNRPDCASVIGIAREIAALTGKELRLPEIDLNESDTPIEELVDITIEDPDGCPRYVAGMIQGIELQTSPFWMRYRLYASGVRSINNVVDSTNYVLLETGQPLHAFDYERLREHRIKVRRALAGERFSTLDGKTHDMHPEHLMICDGERSVALAGIMGGLNSEIFAGSTDVLVESAFFDPVTVRRGSKRLGLSTEASYRFERGTDIEGVTLAAKRALMLISDLTGGKILKGIIDVYPKPHIPPVIDLNVEESNSYLGISMTKSTAIDHLRSLEMEVQDMEGDQIRVIPPSFRVDITRDVDLMEELAILEGYDRIPVTSPAIRPSEDAEPPQLKLQERVSEVMAGLGFSEIITYSFISPDSADLLGAEEGSPLRSFVELQNPLTVDQSVMRTSLVPGLLATMDTNITYEETDLKLFEYGKVFFKNDFRKLPDEKHFLAGIMTGMYLEREWYEKGRKVDFYDIKGSVEALMNSLGLNNLQYKRSDLSAVYHPRISCGVYAFDLLVGSLGRISSKVMEGYDIRTEEAYLFELDTEVILELLKRKSLNFKPFTKYPAVFRDLTLVMDQRTESAAVLDIIKREGADLVESVKIFDLYEGEKMDPSEKALSFSICYRSKDGTLDGKEVNRLHEAIIQRLGKETGGRLREG